MAGVPGLTRLDHVGLTVPDLEAARTWLVEVLGAEYLYSLGPFERSPEWMARHLNVPPEARMEKLHFFAVGDAAVLEVFHYSAPDQRAELPRNSDIGGHHVAFYVEDLDAAVAHLRDRGVEIQGEPTVSTGPSEGQRWVYFLAPWGAQFELVSYPGGKAFFRDRDRDRGRD